jgi:hypothetical protein
MRSEIHLATGCPLRFHPNPTRKSSGNLCEMGQSGKSMRLSGYLATITESQSALKSARSILPGLLGKMERPSGVMRLLPPGSR